MIYDEHVWVAPHGHETSWVSRRRGGGARSTHVPCARWSFSLACRSHGAGPLTGETSTHHRTALWGRAVPLYCPWGWEGPGTQAHMPNLPPCPTWCQNSPITRAASRPPPPQPEPSLRLGCRRREGCWPVDSLARSIVHLSLHPTYLAAMHILTNPQTRAGKPWRSARPHARSPGSTHWHPAASRADVLQRVPTGCSTLPRHVIICKWPLPLHVFECKGTAGWHPLRPPPRLSPAVPPFQPAPPSSAPPPPPPPSHSAAASSRSRRQREGRKRPSAGRPAGRPVTAPR